MLFSYSYSSTIMQISHYFRESIKNTALFLKNPDVLVDLSSIVGVILAQLIDTKLLSSVHYFRLLTACEFVNIASFFPSLASTKKIFFQVHVDRIDLLKLQNAITKKGGQDAVKTINSLKFTALKLQSMNRHSDFFKTKKEFLNFLNQPIQGREAEFQNLIDFSDLEVDFKKLTVLEKITEKSWFCSSVISVTTSLASVLQGLDLLEIGGLAATVGRYAPFLGVVVGPGIEVWTNVFKIGGYFFHILNTYTKIDKKSCLTPEEQSEARSIMVCAVAEVVLSIGTVATIFWLGPVSFAAYPLLITARRVTFIIANLADFNRIVKKYNFSYFASEIQKQSSSTEPQYIKSKKP